MEQDGKCCNPYTVVGISKTGAICIDCDKDGSGFSRDCLCDCTLLPESIYEGQRWQRNDKGSTITVVAVSDTHIAYQYHSGGATCKTREYFLRDYTPVLAEPEKMIPIYGKDWSEATIAEALRKHAK